VQGTLNEDTATLGTSRLQRGLFRIVTLRPEIDGRVLAAVVLAFYFLAVAIPRLFWNINIWPELGVPRAPTLFLDTRVVTAGLECRRLGFDPLSYNPCDPLGRPLNYPRVWLLLRWLGLNQSHTDVLAIAFIVLFLATLFLMVGRISLGKGALLAVALCSPSVMFAIERANTDIVIFSLLAVAVLVWRKQSARARVASPLIVLVAATMKIFPFFGLPAYLFVKRRGVALAALACMAAFAVYAFAFRGDLAAVARGTPQGDYNAYGARILPAAMYHRFVPHRWQGGGLTKQLLAILPLAIGTPALWIVGRRRLPKPDRGAGSWHRLAFYLGSLLFLGTFAAGNNWDYRLVFILLTMPQLFQWIAEPSRDPRGPLAAVATVSIILLLYVGALSKPLGLMDELATWATAGLLLTLLSASIPGFDELRLGRNLRASKPS
jgi:hypothetical protein